MSLPQPPDWLPLPWVLLGTAAVLEVVWALALKESQGFTRPWPGALAVVAAAVSFLLLSLALRDLPVGTGYAVWVGLGAVGVALAGMTLFGESADPWRIGFLVLILVGVAGLHAAEARVPH